MARRKKAVPAEAPKAVVKPTKESTKPLKRRRGAKHGQMTLRTFVFSCGEKPDQLMGFVRWCQKEGRRGTSRAEWTELLDTFRKTPVGVKE